MADFQQGEWVRDNVTIGGVSAQPVAEQSIYLENLKKVKNTILNFNTQVDNLLTSTDGYIKSSLKDPDKNIEYLKVLSQVDYNTTKPDNNTLYFINNIEEPINQIGLILDVVADTKAVWVLTYRKDTSSDVESRDQVILWKSAVVNNVITTGGFYKVKTWNGFIDGKLTLDGYWVFDTEDNFEPYLDTLDEPFVVLISDEKELYGFPSLRFERETSEDEEEDDIDLETIDISNISKAFKIAGNADPINGEEEEVLYVSVEKGYCSEAFRGNDQGIIVVYLTRQGGSSTTKIKYLQYGYIADDSTEKVWSTERTILSRANIFGVEVRRLSDYRIGITYCYRDGTDDNGNPINKSNFIYSKKRTYSGTALRTTNFNVPAATTRVGFNRILYGAVRNDNIDKIPEVVMDVGEMRALSLGHPYKPKDKYLIINERQAVYTPPGQGDLTNEQYLDWTGLANLTPDLMNPWLRDGGVLSIPLYFFTKPVSEEEESKPLTFEILDEEGHLLTNEVFEKLTDGTVNMSLTHLQIGSIIIDIQNDFPYEQGFASEVEYMHMAYKATIMGWDILPVMKKIYDDEIEEEDEGEKPTGEDKTFIRVADGRLYEIGTAIVIYLAGTGPGSGRKDDGFWAYYYKCNPAYHGPFTPFTLTVSSNNTNTNVYTRFLANDLCLSPEHNYEMGNYFCLEQVKASYRFSGGINLINSQTEGVFYPIGVGIGSYGFQTVIGDYGCGKPINYYDADELDRVLGSGRVQQKYNIPYLEFSSSGSNKVVYPTGSDNGFNIRFNVDFECSSILQNSVMRSTVMENYVNFSVALSGNSMIVNGDKDDI